jgi:hypothetical protein
MILILLLLCLVISGYGYITDADRVRGMAESYLSELVRAPVKVGSATLSVFEGLRLDDVRVYADERTDSPDSLLFSAQTFVIKYDPQTMLAGRLQATEIVAQKPQVFLAEDRDAGAWNFQRLLKRQAPRAEPGPAGPPRRMPVLPKVVLRNARVTITEIRGGREVARGRMGLDGQLTPVPDGDRFAFHLQSRGVNEAMGPYATGSVSLSTGHVVAQLMNFKFGRDVQSMLPADVREWWQRHELAGAVSMPEISFAPGRLPATGPDGQQGGRREAFKLVTVLNGVTLAVNPEELMGRGEVRRMREMRETAAAVGHLYAAVGIGSPGARAAPATTRAAAPGRRPPTGAVAGPGTPPRPDHPGDRMAALLTPAKVTLKNVAGTLVFTNSGIEVKDVSGFVESNALKINGRIGGYRPDATVSLQLSSSDAQELTIPASPRYVASLPREVRQLYEEFKPEGDCRIGVRIERNDPDARTLVSGWVQVLDGRFVFHRFPYPLRNVTGRIEFGSGADGVNRLSVNLRGNGIANGPNRDTVLEIKSFGDAIAPIGTDACGVHVRISAKGASSEDELINAFPPEVRAALSQFDAHSTGKYPRFAGDFVTEVVRPVGRNRRWTFDTDIRLDRASGALAAFPYPMHDVTGTLLIRSGYAELVDVRMARGDASLAVSGRVAWTSPDGPRGPQPRYRAEGSLLAPRVDEPVRTDLTLAVRNMPIDGELMAAIPRERREWVQRLGASGRLDVDGRIVPAAHGPGERGGAEDVEWVVGDARPPAGRAGEVAAAGDVAPPAAPPASPVPAAIDYDLKLTLRDVTLRPFGGSFAADAVNGTLRLTPDRLQFERVTGRRGAATLAVRGEIDWPRGVPRIVLDASAEALELDDALYDLLPPVAQRGWDETQPQGTLDAELHYDSVAFDAARRRADALATQPPDPAAAPPDPAEPVGLRVALKPRALSATLKSMPYRLDALTGQIILDDHRVTLSDITGRHGDAKVAVSGSGVLGAMPIWQFRLRGDGLPVDDDLRAALPETLAGLVAALKLDGAVSIDLARFTYRAGPPAAAAAGPAAGAASPAPGDAPAPPLDPAATGAAPLAESDPEIDIEGTVTLDGGRLDVGVPLSDARGTFAFAAAVRQGHLESLRGAVALDSMKMAGRPATDVRAELLKPPGKSELRMDRMRCDVAGGVMSGQMTLVYPDDGASRYALELVVRDADVRTLAGEGDDAAVNGRLTASLSLEGSWGDATLRRGRGDVIVKGREMYRIPLVLGLLQVTNLALPISSPFNEATAVYSLDGARVNFEQIELRASNMLMHGDGWLDFDTKKVALGFSTDNPGGLMKLPFIKELWRGARDEMLKIQVRGTIQEPEVSARSMGTFWTTVDEVFNGGDKPDRPAAQQPAKPAKKRKPR